MDDESYFTLAHSDLPSNAFYYATCKGDAPDSVKFSAVKKFESKLLMWIAISDRGISKPYFVPSKEAVTKEVYSNECIRKRLYPFIKKYHNDDEYLFWPDLASSHYAKLTLQTFEDLKINYVTKDLNPPAVPSLRPIEHFWSILKSFVYKHNWQAENHNQLKRRIKSCLVKVDPEIIQSMMGNVISKLKEAKSYGVH